MTDRSDIPDKEGLAPRIAQIDAALKTGDRSQAVALAEAALGEGLSHPLLYNLRAFKAEAEHRWADALADLQAACALAPSDAVLRNTLGLALGRVGRVREAMQAFSTATVLEPDFHPAWRNLGMAQIAAGDVQAARASLKQAALLAPEDPEPPGQLAALAARRGDWSEAAEMARAALRLDPDIPSATRALAEAEMHAGRLEEAAEQLEAWLARWKGAASTRRLVTGLLGDVRDRQGRYADAFGLYSKGNRETHEGYAKSFGDGSLPEALLRLSAGVASWPSGVFEPAPSISKSPAAKHVFLMGFMRSGTTLLEQALAVRDDVATLEEQEALALSVQSYLSDLGGPARLASADAAALDRHRNDYWERVRGYGVEPAGKVFVDKSPFNGVKLPLIRRLFPEAKIVFSIRDPRDVVLSCFKHRFVVNHYTYQLLNIQSGAKFYNTYMTLVENYLTHTPLPIWCYRHEDLVQSYELQIRSICDFIGLSWREEMRDIGARVRQGLVSSPSAVQLREGLSDRGVQSWKRYEAQIDEILPMIDRWVNTFGYGKDGSPLSPWPFSTAGQR